MAEQGLAAAVWANPANMEFRSLTAYAEFGKYGNSTWALDMEYNGHYVAPSVLCLGLPLGDISVAVSYLRQYSNRLTSGPIQITTPEFPDGTGENYAFERSVDLHSLSGSVRVPVNNQVSVGLTLGGNYLQIGRAHV